LQLLHDERHPAQSLRSKEAVVQPPSPCLLEAVAPSGRQATRSELSGL